MKKNSGSLRNVIIDRIKYSTDAVKKEQDGIHNLIGHVIKETTLSFWQIFFTLTSFLLPFITLTIFPGAFYLGIIWSLFSFPNYPVRFFGLIVALSTAYLTYAWLTERKKKLYNNSSPTSKINKASVTGDTQNSVAATPTEGKKGYLGRASQKVGRFVKYIWVTLKRLKIIKVRINIADDRKYYWLLVISAYGVMYFRYKYEWNTLFFDNVAMNFLDSLFHYFVVDVAIFTLGFLESSSIAIYHTIVNYIDYILTSKTGFIGIISAVLVGFIAFYFLHKLVLGEYCYLNSLFKEINENKIIEEAKSPFAVKFDVITKITSMSVANIILGLIVLLSSLYVIITLIQIFII